MSDIIQTIIDNVPKKSRVLDLGCGNGNLLKSLVEIKNIQALGLEINIECIHKCIQNNIPVLQLDIDKGLSQFSDNQFDIAILHETMQEVKNPLLVFNEMLRVAKTSFIIFHNFAYWKTRLKMFFNGQITFSSNQEWFDTSAIHLMSFKDIESLCIQQNVQISEKKFFGNSILDNFFIPIGLVNLGASTIFIQLNKK